MIRHQSLSRKECVGTSSTTGSKIGFTVANGILSDVYAPTVDATNVETRQYLVTDYGVLLVGVNTFAHHFQNVKGMEGAERNCSRIVTGEFENRDASTLALLERVI